MVRDTLSLLLTISNVISAKQRMIDEHMAVDHTVQVLSVKCEQGT